MNEQWAKDHVLCRCIICDPDSRSPHERDNFVHKRTAREHKKAGFRQMSYGSRSYFTNDDCHKHHRRAVTTADPSSFDSSSSSEQSSHTGSWEGSSAPSADERYSAQGHGSHAGSETSNAYSSQAGGLLRPCCCISRFLAALSDPGLAPLQETLPRSYLSSTTPLPRHSRKVQFLAVVNAMALTTAFYWR